METVTPNDNEPKTDAWYEAEVDRILLELQRIQAQTDHAEEQRKWEAHRTNFNAKMAHLDMILDAIAANRHSNYPISDNYL